MIFKFDADSDLLYAVTPNSKWGTGKVSVDPVLNIITVDLDNGEQLEGVVDTTSCSEIYWNATHVTWLRVPPVKNVHVVFMNHLDVGYNGIPETGFINNVLNTYFKDYFPRAIQLALEIEKIDPDSGFIYTTHLWLLKLYLNCPKNFVLNNITLYCPSAREQEAMEDALKTGRITWHAGPMNMQMEYMNSLLMKIALALNNEFNQKYRCCSQVWSIRDVPGMTGAAITHFNDSNNSIMSIKAVSVGVNPASAPPAVPKLFQWRLFNGSKDAILAMWNAGGYPLNPGVTLSSPGGLSIMDSVISAQDGEALVFSFRTDNSGPPTSLSEIQTTFNVLRQQYPGAKVFASTLDNFVNAVNMSSLPTVYGEIGDTWIQGIASDPRKTALYKSALYALSSCYLSDIYDDMLLSLSLLKLAEHTWGLPTVSSTASWTNAEFQKVKNQTVFKNAVNSWIEQREFYYIAKQRMEANDAIKSCVKENGEYLEVKLPFMDNFTIVELNDTFKIDEQTFITFGNDGSIVYLNTTINHYPFLLASKQSPLGVFTYHTYNESDFARMSSQYDYYGNAGYGKPNSTANANPQSAVYSFPMIGLYRHVNDSSIFLVELEGDPTAHNYYGGPEKVWIQVHVSPPAPSQYGLQLSFEVIIVNKTATRLAEATMFSFTPPSDDLWTDRIYKLMPSYFYSDDNPHFSVYSVVQNGSIYQHAADFVELISKSGPDWTLQSLQVPLVCPIIDTSVTTKRPSPFPYLDKLYIWSDRLYGFAFNIHNNIWNTNYPLWYPFLDKDKTFKANFELQFGY